MPIIPLPVFEEEADPVKRGLTEEDIARYEGLKPPETVVVRYGRMRLIGEFPCQLDRTPGCGTKFVARTPRGIEIAEMLTTTCSNAGCGSSISRKQMLQYIEDSGGKRFPFTDKGRVLRIATPDDLSEMESIQKATAPYVKRVREAAEELRLEMEIVEVEPVLSQDHLTVYYMSENRIDFRELVRNLAREFSCRVEMRQVGARDVARLQADYERCGQHCCCRQFLKVLKPIPMRAAKVQKATLDPLKISGRCGSLMCCLRYEDSTYMELKKRLPHRRSRVGTLDGPGLVLSTQILTQLVLVELEHDRSRVAVAVEDLMDPEQCPKPGKKGERAKSSQNQSDPMRGLSEKEAEKRGAQWTTSGAANDQSTRESTMKDERLDGYRARAQAEQAREDRVAGTAEVSDSVSSPDPSSKELKAKGHSDVRGGRRGEGGEEGGHRKRSRRRGRRKSYGEKGQSASGTTPPQGSSGSANSSNAPTEESTSQSATAPTTSETTGDKSNSSTGSGGSKKKRRRRGKRGGRNRRKHKPSTGSSSSE